MTKCLILETEVSMLQFQRQPQDTIMSRFQSLPTDYLHRASWHSLATLTEVFPVLFTHV